MHTKHLSKRLLAMLLALVMVFSVMPVQAFAAEGDGELNPYNPIVVKNTSTYETYTIYQADEEGNKQDSTTVTNSWKTYYAELPAGVTQFWFVGTPSGINDKVRYSVNNGEWQTWGTYESPTFDAPAQITFQILSGDSYSAEPEGWDDKTVNEFKVWVALAPVAVTSVTLPATYTLDFGSTRTSYLTATVAPADATDKALTWSSSDSSIVSVDDYGGMTAGVPGTATITATSVSNPDIKAECTVTVAEKLVFTIDGTDQAVDLTDTSASYNLSTYAQSISVKSWLDGDVSATVNGSSISFSNKYNYNSVSLTEDGDTTVVVTVTKEGAARIYTITITNPQKNRSDDNALQSGQYGLMVQYGSSWPYTSVTVYQADASGTKMESTDITNEHQYYYAELPEDSTSFQLSVSPNTNGTLGRYSTNDGQSWAVTSNYGTSVSVSDDTLVTIQLISELDYYKNGNDFGTDTSELNEFKLWIKVPTTQTPDPEPDDTTIDSAAELTAAIEGASSGATITLGGNIELPTDWTPLTLSNNLTIDGAGCTVTLNGVSLFAGVYTGNTVKNLKLTGTTSYAGKDSYNSDNHAGALAGALSGTVLNCISDATVVAPQYKNAGGLVGWTYSGAQISNCAAIGVSPTPGSYGSAGAIIGGATAGTITNCYWTADLSADGSAQATITGGGKAESATAALKAINTANASDSSLVKWPIPAATLEEVYFTVYNKGAFAKDNGGDLMYQREVTVTDLNNDDQFSLDEALVAVHKQYNTEAGYVFGYYAAWGSNAVTKVWGEENDGSFGFYRNNVQTAAVDREYLEADDQITAFIYASTVYPDTDVYTKFTEASKAATAGEAFTLTLQQDVWDTTANQMVYQSLSGATIGTFNMTTGEFTALDVTTDSEGVATITLDSPGTYYVTAQAASGAVPLVPPVCVVTVGEASAETPKLTGFTTSGNISSVTFAEDTYQYSLTYTGTNPNNTFFKILPTFDTGKYTASYVYNGGSQTNLTGDSSGAWVMDVPYGDSILTVTVADKNNPNNKTTYTFTVTYPRPTVDTLNPDYGGIYLDTADLQKLQKADATGKPTAEAGNVDNDHFYYYALLPKTLTSVKLYINRSASSVHIRYRVGTGTWTEMPNGGTEVETSEIDVSSGKATVTVQLLSDAAYYQGIQGFTGKTPREFTIWLEAQISTATNTLTGQGTEANPYLLGSAADFDLLDDLVESGESFSGKYFKVTQNVTLSSGWDGIGYANMAYGKTGYATYDVWFATAMTPFAGTLDGGNYTITIHSGDKPLFDCVRTATIRNLKIKGEHITDDGLIANYVLDDDHETADITNVTILSGTKIDGSGFLGGYASSANQVTITNCNIEAGVTIGTATASNIGGFAGDFNGTITGSTCGATVYGKDFVGGIVAGQGQSTKKVKVENCSFSGAVIATGKYVGGIAGSGYTGSGFGIASAPNAHGINILSCSVSGNVTGGDYVGGILGAEPGIVQCWSDNDGIGRIQNNSFTGQLNSSGKYVGGIIGYMHSLNINNQISGNVYSHADKGIGGAGYVDTICTTHETTSGAVYVNTANGKPGIDDMDRLNHNRTDDPLGADAAKLASKKADEPVITHIEITHKPNKLEYFIGEELDLTGLKVVAVKSDNSETQIDNAHLTISGYDETKQGKQTVNVIYLNSYVASFEVTVKLSESTITVYFTLLGDSHHGDNGTKHTLVDGNLTTWIGRNAYSVSANATVLDVLQYVLGLNGYSYSNSGNYISAVGGLAAGDNGSLSGWMYTLNGDYPDLGVAEQYLKNGDSIVFHYTDDYNREYGQETVEKEDAQAVISLISAIGTVHFDAQSLRRIEAAREAYDALTYSEKRKVTNLSVLEAAEEKYQQLKQIDDKEKAQKVDDLIARITTPITQSSQQAINAARNAYNKLTEEQKALVKNLKTLTDAEADLAALTASDADKEKANAVIALIRNLGSVTLDSEEQVKAARTAYDKLTQLQKKLVKNYPELEAAEKQLAALKEQRKYEPAYQSTASLLEKEKHVVGNEWIILGLARSQGKIQEEYYDLVCAYIQENIDEHSRLHASKSTDNARMILALTALGKDATNVAGHDLVAGLKDMTYVKKQGLNGPIWALMALDCGNYPDPTGGDVSRTALINVLLDAQLEDGGWNLSGDLPDPDVTGMALQSLAPYYDTDARIKRSIDLAVDMLSQMQNSDGGFSTGDSATCESVAQVIVALTALGINPDTDERFVKHGNSAVDALLAYYVSGSGFKHILSGKVNSIATEQAYYALTAYARFLEGKTRLYDMTDVFDKATAVPAVEAPKTEPVPEAPAGEEEKGFFAWIFEWVLSWFKN